MYGTNYELFLVESRERIQRSERHATLMASLGPLPKPAPLRLFRRRAIPLSAPIEITRQSQVQPTAEQRAA